jgi:hypothetical protein
MQTRAMEAGEMLDLLKRSIRKQLMGAMAMVPLIGSAPALADNHVMPDETPLQTYSSNFPVFQGKGFSLRLRRPLNCSLSSVDTWSPPTYHSWNCGGFKNGEDVPYEAIGATSLGCRISLTTRERSTDIRKPLELTGIDGSNLMPKDGWSYVHLTFGQASDQLVTIGCLLPAKFAGLYDLAPAPAGGWATLWHVRAALGGGLADLDLPSP